jgi:CHAT domain-containing protein
MFLLACPATAQTESDPAAVVREFFVRYAGGDFRGAAELWVAGAPADKFVAEHRTRQQKRCMRLESLVVTTVAEDVVTTAQTLALRTALPGSIEWMESSRSRFVLRHDGASWRIAEWSSIDRELVEQEQSANTTAFVKEASRRAAAEFVSQGRYDAANDLARSAFAIAERLGDPTAMAIAASAQSMAFIYLDKNDSSVTAATEAVLWAERSGDPDTLARALVRLARAVEVHDGRPPVEPLERALSLHGELEEMSIATQAAIHLGRAHDLRGRRREVMRYAELASRFAEQTNDLPAQTNAALYLGGAYSWIGDLALAEQHIRRGVELSQKGGFKSTRILAIAALADNLLWHVGPEEALKLLDEGLRTIPLSEAVELVLKRARAHLTLGRLGEADCNVDLAASIDAGNGSHAAHLEYLRASIALRRGDDQKALVHLERAQPHLPINGWVRSLLAEVLLNLGREDEARPLLEELIAAEDPAPMTDPQRQLFHSVINHDHRQLVRLFVEARDARSALNVAEQMKATALRQALTEGRVDPHQSMTPADREQEELLDERIRELNRRFVASDRTATEAKAIRKDLVQAWNDLRDFRQRAYAKQPATRVQRPGDLDLDRLPADLDEVTIISYVVGVEKTFAFVIGPKRDGRRTLAARTITTDNTRLHQQINRFAELIEQRNLRTPELAAELYDVLLAPFEDELRSARLVCFIPDSTLWRVPFHALGRDGSALIEKLPVFYSPSINVLAATASMRARKSAQVPTLLALANATVSSETASLYRAFDPDAPLGPIPETEQEVRAIGRIYGRSATRIYTGSDARETTFKREAPAYDILHIATHGLMHPAAPMFSSLVLNASPDEQDDGVLEAREIATLPLDASVAVLSACDTGKADGVQGNAVVGLSWAFLAAGVPTTVVSQWKAQSATTATMMVDFHRHLADDVPTPEALRRAQLALRRDPRYRNPFYWAPFVVIGAP